MVNKILPGTYVDVVAGERDKLFGVTGIVAMPLELEWGATVTEINKGDDTLSTLGYKLSDVKLKLVNEVMNYADKLILYRLNAGVQAQATLASGITAKAVYGGVRGNDVKAVVKVSGSNFIVETYLLTTKVDTQIIATVADFKANKFISITGTGTLVAVTVSLTGGADGTAVNTAYDGFLTELEKQDYNVIAYTGTTAETITKIADFVNEQRTKNVMVQAVVTGTNADNKAIINSTIGGKTVNYELSAAEACSTMAGILAKCGVTSSATYFDVIGWIDVATRLTTTEMETRTQNGETLFVLKYGKVMVLYDINSLTTFTEENPKDFSKGLIVRTLDKYARNLEYLLNNKAIGKIRNHIDGRNQIKGLVTTMTIDGYLKYGYIENFTADDVTVSPATERDSVNVTVGIRVVDTVDKIYITVTAL